MICSAAIASAQHVAISTNVLDWAWFGTANAKVDVTVSRHFSIDAFAKYNPWEFKAKEPDYDMYAKQLSAAIGVSYWPWVVFSDFHCSLFVQYYQSSGTGIFKPALDITQEIGGVISAGYSWMVAKHLNVDVSVGAFLGTYLSHQAYCCPEHLEPIDPGSKFAIRPEDIRISLAYVF